MQKTKEYPYSTGLQSPCQRSRVWHGSGKSHTGLFSPLCANSCSISEIDSRANLESKDGLLTPSRNTKRHEPALFGVRN